MHRKRLRVAVSSCIILVMFFAQAVMAADAPLPELTLEDVTTTVYEELFITTEFGGMLHSYRQDGTVFLAVELVILPQWTEEIKNFRIKTDEMALTGPDGSEFPMIGYFEYIGQFKLLTTTLSGNRRSNWQEEPQKVYYNAVFAVPSGGQSYQLKVGPLSADIEVPADIAQWPDHGSTVNIEILGSRLVDEVKSIHTVDKEKLETTVSNPHGKLLETTLKITPAVPGMGNFYRPENFFWHAPWFWVLCDNGYYTQAVGEHSRGSLNRSLSHSQHYSDGKWSSVEAVLYFAVPKDAKAFTLIYVSSPVAEGVIE
jgi:hypothetical protein